MSEKVVVIVGATGGIGRPTAQTLAKLSIQPEDHVFCDQIYIIGRKSTIEPMYYLHQSPQ
jgi:uncharacterized protein YbjT (DUF2867 family)